MSEPVLSSGAQRLLIDAELAADRETLGGLLAEIAAARPDLELSVCGDQDTMIDGVDGVVLPAGDETAGLEEALVAGRLQGAMVLSARERVLGWARRAELPALAPSMGRPLAEQLSPRELVLSDAAAVLLRARRQREGRPFLVGVNGIDRAGKTEFASRLSDRLEALGFRISRVALADFTAEKKERRAKGYGEADGLFRKHYAMERLREQMLSPMQQCRELPLQIHYDVYDVSRERVAQKRNLVLERDSMVMLEGPFLFQADLFSFFDFRIYLVSDFERAIELALGDLEGKKREKRLRDFQRVELAAQSLYLKQDAPWKRAHLVLRGINTDAPVVERAAFDLGRGEFQAGALD